ncbi:MAG: ABC transporter ATP-binding protein [Candidatus Binatia bacterium]|nr:ABC transporter ATP-binding protein [Candidatus Binatia bacterium]
MERDPGSTPIRARALAKSFGLMPVLRGIDLEVPRGECLALLGANGAGKSTLLRLLAGVSRPSKGSLELFGESCHPDRPPAYVLARIGFVGHEPLVYRDLSPRQNLDFFAQLYSVGGSAAARAERIDQAIESVRLERHADRDVRTLSRGTLQRLALARATLHEPDLLLLDEPFTGLDAPGRERFTQSLATLHEGGTTIGMISHDFTEVTALATRAIVLRGGKIAAELSPVPALAELNSRYRTLVDDGGPHVGDRS